MYICGDADKELGFGCKEIGISFNQCCQECPKLNTCRNYCDYAHCHDCFEKIKIDEHPKEYINISITNADRIRSMNDIEMSMDLIPLIMEICEDGVPCEALFLQWLQSEAE